MDPGDAFSAESGYEQVATWEGRGDRMVNYLAAGVCPECHAVNMTDLKGKEMGFVPKDGKVNITCAECSAKFTLKGSEVAYWRSK